MNDLCLICQLGEATHGHHLGSCLSVWGAVISSGEILGEMVSEAMLSTVVNFWATALASGI